LLNACQCELVWSASGLISYIPKNNTFRFPQYACILIFLLSAGLFHSLWHLSGIAAFQLLLVTITGMNAPCLCLSVPNSVFDCFATLSFCTLPFRVFPVCTGWDHLLIFPTTIQRTFCFFHSSKFFVWMKLPFTAFSFKLCSFAACLLSSFPFFL
jgi:hypothetical protein